ncbi:hypothetical protein BLX24_15510 [Arsenicibacter rosenii]|uniref:DUF4270 domain-containing protein n=1 Tax=Arsenicibacter rosenii TaxID=1750698 RepID=A0A1S2VI11_9BACT|nr:hypothetical protein BLX24_15510 [Arsenicibacter rosenii]
MLAKATLFAGSIVALAACQEPKEIGLDPTSPVGVFYTDTLTINRSTILFDSVRTNKAASLLVGRYTDPVFGPVTASAFTQLSLGSQFIVQDSLKVDIPAGQIVHDSTFLYLQYTYAPVYGGDTLQTHEVSVHRLTEDISRTKNYNYTSSIAYSPQPLGKLAFKPTPVTSAYVKIPMDAAFGKEIVAVANKDAGKADSIFQQSVKGLALIPGANNPSVLAFNPMGTSGAYTSVLQVYYHIQGKTTALSQTLMVSMAQGRFNRIVPTRAGTLLSTLKAGQATSSVETKGQTFVQPGTGVTTKIEIPGLSDLKKRRVAINRADLVITPVAAPSTQLNLPPYLALAEVNAQNQLLRYQTTDFVQFVPVATSVFNRTASSWYYPQVSGYNTRNKSYTFDMTGYFQTIMSGLTPNNGLLLMTPSTGNLVDVSTGVASNLAPYYLNDRLWRMILDGKASVKVIVFYTNTL